MKPSPGPEPELAQLVAAQQALNRTTAPLGDAFAGHRARLTGLITDGPPGAGARLALLGAGNANDVQLDRLAAAFREVHLVDLDPEALQGALRRCPRAPDSTFVGHGGVDLSGILPLLAAYRRRRPPASSEPDRQAIDEMCSACLATPPPPLGGRFDVVVSCCLLSQLVDVVVETLGPAHPRRLELVLAVRRRHLRDLVALLADGGRAWLVTDVVSSETVPALARIPEPDLPDALVRLIQEHNVFLGLNPFAIVEFLRRDPWFAARCDRVVALRPWHWDMGFKQLAVVAIGLRGASR